MVALSLATICSGIGAPEVALHGIGYRSIWCSQFDPEHNYKRSPDFPSAVLAHHFPEVPNHGDFTALLQSPPASPDVLIGGTPCQSFSVAGLGGGLSDPRGGLALAFVSLVGLLRPRWIVWENVPGVFSADDGCAFGSLLSGLGRVGYGWAYRVLDAQYFGVAQRRERVFVVGHSGGDWRRAGAVLFEPEGLRWNTPTRGEAREGVAGALGASASGRGWRCGADEVAAGQAVAVGLPGDLGRSLTAHGGRFDSETETLIAHTLRGEGHDASEDGTGRGSPLVPICFDTTQITSMANRSRPEAGDPCHTLNGSAHPPAIAFNWQSGGSAGRLQPSEQTSALSKSQTPATFDQGVRRLTPREMERLQGFPDDFTRIPWRGKPAEDCPDGPRAKALGNSMAVPVLRWIGRRIQMVDALP